MSKEAGSKKLLRLKVDDAQHTSVPSIELDDFYVAFANTGKFSIPC
jgi:hypothetical protein